MKAEKAKGRICPTCKLHKPYSSYAGGDRICIPCTRIIAAQQVLPDCHPIYTMKW